MRKNIIYCLLAFISSITAHAQEAPDEGAATPLSGNAMAASSFENTPVNYFTGLPAISIPLFSYSDQNGLALNMSLDYSPGGIPVNASPSTAGLGWAVNVGGSVVRTIRGVPDDIPGIGYLYAHAVPADFHDSAYRLYHQYIDAQQDIFQFNINGRSGKFFIGKNKQIVCIPLSKLRITYTVSPTDSIINSFCITTEQGIKYVFNETELGSTTYTSFDCGFAGRQYNTAWNLSYITSIFAKDTISFFYHASTQTRNIDLGYTANILPGDSTVTGAASSTGSQSIITRKLMAITFPDKKRVTLVYDPFVQYDKYDFALNSIHICDSVFRYGYQFVWDNVHRSFLTGLNTYTATYIKPGYSFSYNTPYFAAFGSEADTLGNKFDHWGYYTGAAHDTDRLPLIAGLYNGMNRAPTTAAVASSLSTITDVSGGKTFYTWENNEAYRYLNLVPEYKILDCKKNEQAAIHLKRVTNNRDSFSIRSSTFITKDSSYPFPPGAKLVWRITNADSSVVYATDSVSLVDLFFRDSTFSFIANIAEGDYLFKTRLSAGDTTSANALPITLCWINEIGFAFSSMKVGGVRIKQISHFDPVTGRTDTISTYKYKLANGRSSGFLGTVPSYLHPYTTRHINMPPDTTGGGGGGEARGYIAPEDDITQPYLTIAAEPVNNLAYTQGNPVGYSRVEVIKGSDANNTGKEIYEFTTLEDAGGQVNAQIFPYAPFVQRDWAIGLNKRTAVYDSSGRLVQQTVNTYNTITTAYTDSNFRSVKLGLIGSTYINDSLTGEKYAGEYYFPETGRADLVSTTQTFYHADNSEQVKTQQVEYDSNYNAVKMTSVYDQSRGLSLERRMYYPYHYSIGGTIGKLRDSLIYTVVSTEDWITGDSNPRIVAASTTDFKQLPNGSIKPVCLYALQTKAPIPSATYGAFNDAALLRNSTYLKKQQEFADYDSVGNCTEVKNSISGQSNAVIMDYQNRIPVARISNASYKDVAYTSFEADGSGNWLIASAQRNDSLSITGKRSYDLSNGNITKDSLSNTLTYIVSYWKKASATVSISGASGSTLLAEQDGWKLYSQTVSAATSVTVSGSGLIDELRLYPKDANMATSTFDPLIGITSACDANNTITYYEYDKINRLVLLRDKDKNIIKKYEYSDSLFTRYPGSATKVYMRGAVWNPATSQYEFKCMYYWRYADGILSEGFSEPDLIHCPRNESAGPGLINDL